MGQVVFFKAGRIKIIAAAAYRAQDILTIEAHLKVNNLNHLAIFKYMLNKRWLLGILSILKTSVVFRECVENELNGCYYITLH